MEYEEIVNWIVRAIEGAGIIVLIAGGLAAFFGYVRDFFDPDEREQSYHRLRRKLARVILLGLEVLLLADIIRTIVVDASPSSVAVLGAIVVIRILLSFSLEVEIDGAWPWNRWRTQTGDADSAL